jgi:hypothetical protein
MPDIAAARGRMTTTAANHSIVGLSSVGDFRASRIATPLVRDDSRLSPIPFRSAARSYVGYVDAMNARVIGSLVLIAAVGATATGCQYGEYAMSERCADFSAKVSAVVDDAYSTASQVENRWAGEATVWCRFDVVTGMDLARDAPARTALREQVQTLLEDTFRSNVSVRLLYQADDDLLGIEG